jgi:hypothetical protein
MSRYREDFSTFNSETNQISANSCNAIAFINQSTAGEICFVNNLRLAPQESYSSNFNEDETNETTYNISWFNNIVGNLIIIKKVIA